MKQLLILLLMLIINCENTSNNKQSANSDINTAILIIGKTLPEYSQEEVINLSSAIDPIVDKFDGYYGRKMLISNKYPNLIGDIVFYRDITSFEKASEIELQSTTCQKFFATMDPDTTASKIFIAKPIFMTQEKQGKTGVVEIVISKTKDNYSEDEIIAAAKNLNPLLDTFDGFLSRKLLLTEDKYWIDVLYWTDMQEAKSAFAKIGESTIALPYLEMADENNTQIHHFNVVIDTEK